MDDAPLKGGYGSLGTVGDVQAAQDHVDVPLHGGLADTKSVADFLVRQAFHDELKHLQLSRAELGMWRAAGEAFADRRRQEFRARVDGADCGGQFL